MLCECFRIFSCTIVLGSVLLALSLHTHSETFLHMYKSIFALGERVYQKYTLIYIHTHNNTHTHECHHQSCSDSLAMRFCCCHFIIHICLLNGAIKIKKKYTKYKLFCDKIRDKTRHTRRMRIVIGVLETSRKERKKYCTAISCTDSPQTLK